jgi:hypothetical protein
LRIVLLATLRHFFLSPARVTELGTLTHRIGGKSSRESTARS